MWWYIIRGMRGKMPNILDSLRIKYLFIIEFAGKIYVKKIGRLISKYGTL